MDAQIKVSKLGLIMVYAEFDEALENLEKAKTYFKKSVKIK